MDLLAPVKAFDRLQRRRPVLGLPFAVVKKFGDDQAGNLAALIAYYGFFALFPLLLLFVTILGYVLQNDPEAQKAVVDSTLSQIPIIGSQLETGSLKGSGVALFVGIVGTLLSGLGVTQAAQTAFNRAQGVPHRERPNFLWSRLRGLGLLAILGTLQIVSTAASSLVTGGLGGTVLVVAGVVLSLALNFVLFVATFRLLTDASVPTRELWPGIVSATLLWTILQAVGGAYISSVVKGAGDTYGTFATVIGLLTWLFLGARVVVYSAELNSVLARRLWPRGLLEPLTDADREALRALARIEERSEEQQVEVSFAPPEGAGGQGDPDRGQR